MRTVDIHVLCSLIAIGATMPYAAATELTPVNAPGAHTFLGQGEGIGRTPAITRPVTTAAHGSLYVAFNAGYASNDAEPHDSYANRWTRLGAPMSYANYGDRFSVQAYVSSTGRGGPAHTVSLAKRGEPEGELSLAFVEVRDATTVLDVARTYAEPGLVVTSGEVHVDGPATLLAFWWGDGAVKRMTALPDDGFQMLDRFVELPDESGVQGAVAWKRVDAAGTYRVHWKVAPVQGAALWLIAIR